MADDGGPDEPSVQGGPVPRRRAALGYNRTVRRPAATAAAVVLLAVLASCASEGGEVGAPTTAGHPTETGAPNDLVASLDVTEEASTTGATTRRVTYRSVDITGEPSLATALVVTPDGAAPGDPVIAWGHSTTGTGDACAPSQLGAPGIPGIDDLLARGWVVVAADYEGLGTPGPHPYLVSQSEARSIFDALRAAAEVPGAAVSSGAPVVLWGLSQGGHAVLAAAERATTEAPDLDVRGVAVAAPVSDVTGFLERSRHPDQLGVLIAIVHGARLAEPDLDPAAILTPIGLEVLDAVDRSCISELITAANRPLDELLLADPAEDPAWREVLDAQRPGDAGTGMPVLVLHGAADEIIPVSDSEALVERLCAAGDPVRFVVRPGDGHGVATGEDLTGWIEARVTGAPAPSDCTPP